MQYKKTLTCIICPNSCCLEVFEDDKSILHVHGNKCRRGVEYATQELNDPRRTLSTTVRIRGAIYPLCSVRLNRPLSKKEVFHVMEEIKKHELNAPVHIGQVLIKNVCGLDSDVIVTKEL